MLGARRVLRSSLLAFALLLVAPAASALITVGPSGSGCRFTKLQDAIDLVLNTENGHESVDPYIGVAGNSVYNEALNIDGANIGSYTVSGVFYDHPFVQIYGDYDSKCQHEVTDGSVAPAQISGANTGGSVMFIHGASHVELILNHLQLVNANNTSGNATGGAINFTGAGNLDISNTTIYNNEANFGGGIFANGLGAGIQLTLHAGTIIQNNLARTAGGGIRLEGAAHLLALESPTLIYDNTANPNSSDGTGGGLQLFGSETVADVGSAGYFGLGVIYGNHARNGGGITVGGGGTLRLFSSIAGQPTRIEYNDATQNGGGIWTDTDFFSNICANGYAIDNNSSADGAAVFIGGVLNGDGSGSGSTAFFQPGVLITRADGSTCGSLALMPAHVECQAGAICNTMDGNMATKDDGAVFVASKVSFFSLDDTEFRGNTAGRVLQLQGHSTELGNLLITNNVLRREVANVEPTIDTTPMQFISTTIAGNTINGSAPVFSVPCCGLKLYASIVWQPFNAILSAQPSSLTFDDLITSDPATGFRFDQRDNVSSADPLFLDPTGDYHLTPLSPAVNYYSASDTHFSFDVRQEARCRQVNLSGPESCDAGAFAFLGNEAIRNEILELQALYQNTNGANWTNHTGWNLISVDPCTSWFGISCNSDHSHITQIFLPANHLVGSLPDDFFSHFPDLNYFDVAFNELSGPVPSLHSRPFIHFRINDNHLSGPLPSPPPVPATYTNADFTVCPNYLAVVNNATWDTLVSFGTYAWWRDCDGIFANGFGN